MLNAHAKRGRDIKKKHFSEADETIELRKWVEQVLIN